MDFSTKCTCKVTDKKGIYQLSHADGEHKDERVAPKAEEKRTKIEDDPSAAIALGPHDLTTTEPGSEMGDEDKITFTGVWYIPVVQLDDNENTSNPLIVNDANDVNDDGMLEMPDLRPHRDDDSSDDEDDDVYVPKKMGHCQKRKALFDVKTLMLEAKGETETEFIEIEN
jgi:hypothetical protein